MNPDNTITTTLHSYRFDLNKEDEAAAWHELQTKLRADGLRCFESWGGDGSHYIDNVYAEGIPVKLETRHLFDNQWNTAPFLNHESGMRVFDWALDYKPYGSSTLKRGHWLEQTAEMRDIREQTSRCGYCGHQYATGSAVFCNDCLGSAYLKESDLYLLRLVPVCRDSRNRVPLDDAESAELLPLYVDAQLKGKKARNEAEAKRERERVEKLVDEARAKGQRLIDTATREREAMLWLLDRGFKLDNVIYYDHTGRFCFGWRTPIGATLLSALLDVISEFPGAYDIKCEDGRKLSGD